MSLKRKCQEAGSSENYESKLSIAEENKERLDELITRVKEDK